MSLPNSMVRVRNLSVVGRSVILRAEWFRRIIRTVRGRTEMEPQEKRTLWSLLDPRNRMRDALIRAAVYESDVFPSKSLR